MKKYLATAVLAGILASPALANDSAWSTWSDAESNTQWATWTSWSTPSLNDWSTWSDAESNTQWAWTNWSSPNLTAWATPDLATTWAAWSGDTQTWQTTRAAQVHTAWADPIA